MRKIFSVIFSLLFIVLTFSGCGNDESEEAYLTVEFAPESGFGLDLNDTYFRGSGAEFDIIVNSNSKWIVDRNSKLRFDPAFGERGTTKVHITLPKSTSKEVKQLNVEFLYGMNGYTQAQDYYMFQLPSAIIRIDPEPSVVFKSYSDSEEITLITNQPFIPHFDLTNTEGWVSIDYVPGSAHELYDYGMSVKCRITVQPNTTEKIRETWIKVYNGGPEFEDEDEYSRSIAVIQDK